MTAYQCKYLVVTIVSVIVLSGCSYVPDKLNPIEWASDGYDWLLGEDDYSYSNSNLRNGMKEERTLSGLPKCQGTDFMAWHDCEGTYRFSNGDQYVGNWKNGKRTGQGTYTWPDGEKYVGAFKDGMKNGHGTIYFSDGEVWVGEFRDGRWVSGDKYGAGENAPAH